MDIRAHLPDAQIDWVVESGFAPLLAVSPGVNQVIECDIRRWRKSWWTRSTRLEFKEFKERLQKTDYDAVIDLQGLSKSAFVSWLASLSPTGKRFAIGNQTDGASYEPITRWVADTPVVVQSRVHAVERSRIICARALGYEYPAHDLDSRSGFKGRRTPSLAVTPSPLVLPNTVALIHASSRDDKTWPLAYWTELGQALQARGFNIALPQGSEAELEQARKISNTLVGSKVWLKMSLDEVSAHLAACVGVIGVDSGLSHIAEALDLPLVQIYNFETNWRTGPTRHPFQTSVYAEPTPSVKVVLAQWDASWELYESGSHQVVEQQSKKLNQADPGSGSEMDKSLSDNGESSTDFITSPQSPPSASEAAPQSTPKVKSSKTAKKVATEKAVAPKPVTIKTGTSKPASPKPTSAKHVGTKPVKADPPPSPQLGLFD